MNATREHAVDQAEDLMLTLAKLERESTQHGDTEVRSVALRAAADLSSVIDELKGAAAGATATAPTHNGERTAA